MAKGSTSSTIRIHLDLSEDEASWLRALLQNPLRLDSQEKWEVLGHQDTEDPRDRNIREGIFNAIPPICS